MFRHPSPSAGSSLGRMSPVFLSADSSPGRVSPVGSPWLSEIFAGSQKSSTPRTPSGPRFAPQAAGPSTRPGVAGDTFPRFDTLPGVASERRFIVHFFLAIFHFLSHLFLSAARVGRITALCLTTPSGILTEWERLSLISFPLTLVIILFPRDIGNRSIHLPGLDRAECIAIRPVAAS